MMIQNNNTKTDDSAKAALSAVVTLLLTIGLLMAALTPSHAGIVGNDGAVMARIPGGSFSMGDNLLEGTPNELPKHTVYVSEFYIDVYEVTNALYANFLNASGAHVGSDGKVWLDIGSEHVLIELVDGQYIAKPGFADHPVITVSWYGAAAYAQWAGKRLPTEAEWEKAARGKKVANRYPWGNGLSHRRANYKGVFGGDKWAKTAPVARFRSNGYGLYDMAGNVWEWCMDKWDSEFYAVSPKTNPIAGGRIAFVNDAYGRVKSHRVMRGGSWFTKMGNLRCANRDNNSPEVMYFDLGFRCAQDAR